MPGTADKYCFLKSVPSLRVKGYWEDEALTLPKKTETQKEKQQQPHLTPKRTKTGNDRKGKAKWSSSLSHPCPGLQWHPMPFPWHKLYSTYIIDTVLWAKHTGSHPVSVCLFMPLFAWNATMWKYCLHSSCSQRSQDLNSTLFILLDFCQILTPYYLLACICISTTA